MNEAYFDNSKRLLRFFEEEDTHSLRGLSEEITRKAALGRDSALLEEAVLAYALGKLVEKTHYSRQPEWDAFKERVQSLLKKSIDTLMKGDGEAHKRDLELLSSELDSLDKRHGQHVRAEVDNARLRVAFTLYESGYSTTAASEFARADKLELLKYVGNAKTHERFTPLKSINQRVKDLENALK